MRRSSAAAGLVAAGLLAVSCGQPAAEGARRPSSAARASASASSRFDLIYERTVDGNADVYLLPAGGLERRLTDHPGADALARWSPDGQTVFFTSDRTGNWQIYRVDVGGGEPLRVRTNGTTDWQVDVSPDGSSLAFLSKQEGPESLYVRDLRSGAERMLVRHGRRTVMGNPDWSPDGRRIVFSSNRQVGHHIYMVDLAGQEDRRITELYAGGCEPRFHPDGRRVVYVRRGLQSKKSRLTELDLASGEEKTLVDWPALNYNPVYSPDGSELAFSSNITGDWVVYRQRLSDGHSWRVTHGPGSARNPDYRPRS